MVEQKRINLTEEDMVLADVLMHSKRRGYWEINLDGSGEVKTIRFIEAPKTKREFLDDIKRIIR